MSTDFDKLEEKYGKEFFQEEILCDFLVDAETKKGWAIELEMLEYFTGICEKYGLRFYAICGTLLGAIRHKGFIPWDDDIDVAMPREDYEMLLKIGASECKHPYFFQTPYTDKKYGYSYAKIRNSQTTWISRNFVKKGTNMNMGLALDIFPLDLIPYSKIETLREEIMPFIMRNLSSMKKGALFLEDKDREQIEKYYSPCNNFIRTWDALQICARQYEKDKLADFLAISIISAYTPERLAWPKRCFDEWEYVDFETTKIRVPKMYDEILKINYGNYMEFPPVEKRGAWHTNICYPDIPYTEGIRKWMEVQKRGGGVRDRSEFNLDYSWFFDKCVQGLSYQKFSYRSRVACPLQNSCRIAEG